MNINNKTLTIVNLLYCYIPTFLFLLGWVKLWYSIPISIVLLYILVRYILQIPTDAKSIRVLRTALLGGGVFCYSRLA